MHVEIVSRCYGVRNSVDDFLKLEKNLTGAGRGTLAQIPQRLTEDPGQSTAIPESKEGRLLSIGGGAGYTEDRKGRAKLSSCPSGSIKWKKRSPHSASRGAVVGWHPAASARS